LKTKTEYLSDYIIQVRGVSYKPNEITEEPLPDFLPILRATNFDESGLKLDSLIYISKTKVKNEQIIKEGDILLAASSGSKDIVGKNVQFKKDFAGTFGAFCKLIRINNNISSSYVGQFFKSYYYKRHIRKSIQGANINNLRNEHLDNLKIKVPDLLSDQIHIANILEQSEKLISDRKESIRLLDELIKSIFFKMFGDPVKNEKGFPTIIGKNLFTFSSGKFNPKENLNDKYEYPCFGGNGITGYSQNYLIDYNTLVIGRVGAYCGNVHLVAAKSWITDNAIYIKDFKKKQNLKFLFYLFKFLKLNRFAAVAGQPKITQGPLESLMFLDIKEALQNQFAEIVEKIEAMKAKYNASLAEMENLYGSLSQRAFRGELKEKKHTVVEGTLNLTKTPKVSAEFISTNRFYGGGEVEARFDKTTEDTEEKKKHNAPEIILKEIIETSFGNEPFSFERLMDKISSIKQLNLWEYKEIKEEIFNCVRGEGQYILEQSFSKEEKKMLLKLVK
jgi:type I restriction enzyme S subunit